MIMSNASSKSTSSEAFDSQRQSNRSQPLDDMLTAEQKSGVEKPGIGGKVITSVVGEVNTTPTEESGIGDKVSPSAVHVETASIEQKNRLIEHLKLELTEKNQHESELQENIDYFREKTEKLEHKLHDIKVETFRTREHQETQWKMINDDARIKLAVVEKMKAKEKYELMNAIKILKDQRNELELTVNKLQDNHKKKDMQSRESFLSLKEMLNEKQALENKRFEELCDTQVKLAQTVAQIARQAELLKDKDLALAQENQKKLESENQQLKQQHESSQTKRESGFDVTNSGPVVGEAETTKEAGSKTHFPDSQTQQSYIVSLGDDTDTTIQGGEIDEQDEEDHNLTYREQETIPEAVEEIKSHQQQEMLLTTSNQKSGAKSLDSGDPIKNSVGMVFRESERKNTMTKVDLATCKHHESKLQEEVDHLREEHEKLEHQLIDKEKETDRTRKDHQKEIAMFASLLQVNIHEVEKAKMQLANAEKQNEEEKQKLMEKIKAFELESESTVSKLQDNQKKTDLESKETNQTRKDDQNEIAILESQLQGNIQEIKKAKIQLANAEKQNVYVKLKLMYQIKALEDQGLELKSTVIKLQDDQHKKDIESKEFILVLKTQLNDQQALKNKRFEELCDTRVKLAVMETEFAKLKALLKDKELDLAQENQKKLESENQLLKQRHESFQANLKEIEDEERKKFKKLCETKEKLEAQVQIAEKHLLFAHEKKKMLELSIQSSTLESASSMTSGVESMDEQSEFDPDRKAELEAMDTFTGQIDVSNEPFGKSLSALV